MLAIGRSPALTAVPALGYLSAATALGATQRLDGQRFESREYDGVPLTIDDMRRLVGLALQKEQDPALRKLVDEIIAQVEPKDYLSEIAACYYFVLKHVRYTRDPLHIERVQHPFYTLTATSADRAGGRRGRSGDCDDLATTLAAMVMVIGNQAEFVTVTTDASRGFHHVFTVVKVPDGRRIVLDPVPGPNVTEMIHGIARYQSWPVEPVRVPGRLGWSAATRPGV